MKKLIFNDIREFCKTHYGEYMGEPETAITFYFGGQDFTKNVGFLDVVEDNDLELNGTWVYDGCDMFGDNRCMFRFKRIA